ncbi:MAG: rhodanese-related sulfurtransferase [Chlamydiales bacterium]|jgi:rhodanese-related sulfurtransferase
MKAPTLNGLVEAWQLDSGDPDDWLLIDVRTPREFQDAHIDGSLNAPLGALAQGAATIRSRAMGKYVVLICRTGQRAEKARKLLRSERINALHVLNGGIVGWDQAGLPLERGESGMSLERQVRIAAGALVVIGVALGFMLDRGFFGLSGIVGAGLVIAGMTDTCAMGMFLAKMPWNNNAAACRKE